MIVRAPFHCLSGRWATPILAAFATSALLACGGSGVPFHDGYRTGADQPWKKPKTLELDEYLEAEDDGELSYPRRRRARWFALALPEGGSLEIRLEAVPLGATAEAAELEDADDPFDVAFEVYDRDHRLLERADNQSDDVGDRKRSRTVKNLLEGSYLIHVYLQRRLDEVEYNLRVKFSRGAVDVESDFPAQVAFVEPLPVVPAFDDAPERARRCRGRRCRRGGTKRPASDKPSKPADESGDDVPAGAMTARIIGVRQAPSGTHITINVGESRGVALGWKGRVVTGKGKAIPGGDFTIKKVTARTATATVSASPDSVTGAARVRLAPP